MRPARFLPLVLLCGLLLTGPRPARAETEVDLALVIAVDISFSMDHDEQVLQRDGFVEAFRSAAVHEAIARGMLGRIAVTYVEWAGASDQRVLLPWTVLEGKGSAEAFAAAIARQPTRRAARTSLSGIIDFASRLFGESGVQTDRQVIDISGDGPNNQGRAVTAARDAAVDKGITINALPIMLKTAGYFDLPDLEPYFRDCVIGGPGAFMVPVREREGFVAAIKTKILMEVAAAPLPGRAPAEMGGGLVVPAASGGPRANCFAGEAQWRDRMGP